MRKMIFVFGLLVSTLIACTPPDLLPADSDSASQNDGTDGSGQATRGKALYDRYCLSCHGEDALGTQIWSGSIQGYDPIDPLVKNGRGGMAPIPVEDPEIAAIQAYLNSFGVDLSALSGEEFYAAQCATCHGADGEGTADGPVIQFTSPGYAEWVVRNGRDGAGYPGEMPSYAAEALSDQQWTEMLDFLHSRERPVDGAGLYNVFCSHCHGDTGAGGTAGKPIGGHAEIDEVVRVGKGNDYASRTLFMPSWTATELSDAEVQLISDFVGGLPEN